MDILDGSKGNYNAQNPQKLKTANVHAIHDKIFSWSLLILQLNPQSSISFSTGTSQALVRPLK